MRGDDLTRREFGRWRVIWRVPFGRDQPPGIHWVCRCSYGAVEMLRGSRLLCGGTKQCKRCLADYGPVGDAKPAPSLFDVVQALRIPSRVP